MQEPNIKVSVITPALNEENNVATAIRNTLDAFREIGISGEIIVINDGSTDRTRQIVQNIVAKDTRVKMVTHEKPLGLGASFWDGVEHAQGEVVVVIPGDNENDPFEILRYYKLLDHVDLVIPFIFNREVRPMFRNTLSLMYRFIVNSTFVVNFNYTNGTILYRRDVLREIEYRSSSFFFQTDALIRMVKKGYLFAEVPYRLGVRKEGKSSAVSFPSLMQVIKGYIRLIKDLYFSKDSKIAVRYSKDSATAARRKNENSPT